MLTMQKNTKPLNNLSKKHIFKYNGSSVLSSEGTCFIKEHEANMTDECFNDTKKIISYYLCLTS